MVGLSHTAKPIPLAHGKEAMLFKKNIVRPAMAGVLATGRQRAASMAKVDPWRRSTRTAAAFTVQRHRRKVDGEVHPWRRSPCCPCSYLPPTLVPGAAVIGSAWSRRREGEAGVPAAVSAWSRRYGRRERVGRADGAACPAMARRAPCRPSWSATGGATLHGGDPCWRRWRGGITAGSERSRSESRFSSRGVGQLRQPTSRAQAASPERKSGCILAATGGLALRSRRAALRPSTST